MDLLYERGEVEQIVTAYKDIFPSIDAPLSRYWGLDRRRPWSYVTTDFHQAAHLSHVSLGFGAMGLGVAPLSTQRQ
ncbi:hypothetical protein PSUB009319_02460 [Ralstonia sp. SET104]|nr:hypothetical protein PSUB009319_02460 [Ralstonia sp. SET104]